MKTSVHYNDSDCCIYYLKHTYFFDFIIKKM